MKPLELLAITYDREAEAKEALVKYYHDKAFNDVSTSETHMEEYLKDKYQEAQNKRNAVMLWIQETQDYITNGREIRSDNKYRVFSENLKIHEYTYLNSKDICDMCGSVETDNNGLVNMIYGDDLKVICSKCYKPQN